MNSPLKELPRVCGDPTPADGQQTACWKLWWWLQAPILPPITDLPLALQVSSARVGDVLLLLLLQAISAVGVGDKLAENGGPFKLSSAWTRGVLQKTRKNWESIGLRFVRCRVSVRHSFRRQPRSG